VLPDTDMKITAALFTLILFTPLAVNAEEFTSVKDNVFPDAWATVETDPNFAVGWIPATNY